MRVRTAVALLALMLLGAACDGPDYTRDALVGTSWVLVEAEGTDGVVAATGDVTAEFADGIMQGWTGCNSYEARYRVQEPDFHLTEVRWTEAGCPTDDLFRQEQLIQDVLATVDRVEIDDTLVLRNAKEHTLTFETGR